MGCDADYSEIRKQNETMDKNLVWTLSWEEKGLSCRGGVETMMEEAGFFFYVLALVHSYCFFLHISDKRGAFRTVLCEKRSKKRRIKIISYYY